MNQKATTTKRRTAPNAKSNAASVQNVSLDVFLGALININDKTNVWRAFRVRFASLPTLLETLEAIVKTGKVAVVSVFGVISKRRRGGI